MMKALTIIQAAALVLLALYGVTAGADNAPACTLNDVSISCQD